MALATQCPHCQTTFRVAHDQLKLRSGLVRCGTCKQIFNGIEHLVSPDALPSAAAATPAASIPALTPTLPASPAAGDAASIQVAAPPPAAVNPAHDSASSKIDFVAFGDTPEPEPESVRSDRTSAAADSQPPSPTTDQPEDSLQGITLIDFSAMDEEDFAQQHSTPPVPAGEENPAPAGTSLAAPSEPDASETIIAEQAAAQPSVDQPVPAETVAPEEVQQTQEANTETVPPEAGIGDVDDAGDMIDEDHAADAQAEEVDEPDFVIRSRKRQRIGRVMRIVMALASVVLLLALVLQGAYAFRQQLAAWFPQTKPALAELCHWLGCQVQLPAQIDMVSIESNELQAIAADQNTFMLTLLLRNRSRTVQAWPNIELTLNDANESPLARRVLTPADYLPAAQMVGKGFAANAEQPVKVSFELKQLKASGYRVYLFYP